MALASAPSPPPESFSDRIRGSNTSASSASSPPAFTFVTHTGPPSRSPDTQRLVRRHVMQQVGKSRRKGRPVKAPLLEFSLEVPDEPFWDGPSLELPQHSVLDQSTIHRPNEFSVQGPDADPSIPELEASYVSPRSTNRFQQRITQYAQNPRLLPYTDHSEKERHQNEEIIAHIERLWAGRSDPFARYPIKMNLRAHELIDHTFDDRYTKSKPFRYAWFPVSMLDAAAFHQVLANSALNIALLRNMDEAPESYEAISHHTCAINLVNKRLSDPSFATSDEIIGAVTAFICYYNILGNTKSWRIHMNGIKEIVRLRGGPDSPSFSPFVRLILSVADIGGSCNQDIPATFPLPYFVPSNPIYPVSIDLPLLSAQISLTWRTLLPSTHHSIITIIDDLSRLTAFLKAEVIRTKGAIYQEAQFAATYINPILHRLLRLSHSTPTEPASDTTNNENETDISDGPTILQEATRLAAILYLGEIRRNFGILPVMSTVQLSKLHSLLSRPSSYSASPSPSSQNPVQNPWTHFPALYLWVLAMGVAESRDEVQRASFKERMFEATELTLDEVVEKILKRFLWIDELHGMMFRRNLRPLAEEGLEEV